MAPSHDTPAYYLLDLGTLLKEMALEALQKAKANPGDNFSVGRSFAFYEVLSLMKQQAEGFELDDASIGFAGFDPDQEFLK